MEKDPNFVSLHADPYMVWQDNRICHDCLNNLMKLPYEVLKKLKEPRACDVFENIDDVNHAIETNHCDFYLKSSSK